MIHWLVQSSAAHPDLASGQPWPGLLSEAEGDHFNGFRVLKRRQDWLLGRWTVKRLLQAMIEQVDGHSPALEQISILPGPDGAPQVSFAPPFEDLDGTFTVSISHAYGSSLCAATTRPDWPLGADIEHIEPRPARFATDFFTEEELAQVGEAPAEWRDTLVTAVWSAKEAALKAVRLGLRSDTRVVSCRFMEPGQEAPGSGGWQPMVVGGEEDDGWLPLQLEWRRQAAEAGLPRLVAWWRVSGEFVLTLAGKEMSEGVWWRE